MKSSRIKLLGVVAVAGFVTGPTASAGGARQAFSPPSSDTMPELPRLLNTARGTYTRSVTLGPSGNLQAALDAAKAGDRIVLPCGAMYRGNFVLRGNVGAGWRELSSSCELPAEGTRISPSTPFARIVSPNGSAAITVAPGATRWRLVGLRVSTEPTVSSSNALIELGNGNAASNAELPRNIILDRVYVHGWPTQWVHRCIGLNADSTSIIDSYVSECHADIDSQAICGWNANGPNKISNNYLEASGEVVCSGGADPRIPNLVPSDWEITRNHITRPMAWKGGKWLIKNLIEFKNGRRILIDGNVIENSWPHGQLGWAFVLWSVNQQGHCPWCITSDVTIRNNLIRNIASGFELTDKYNETPSPAMTRIAIINNVVIGLASPLVGDGGYGFLVQNKVDWVRIEHNTMFKPSGPVWMWPAYAAPVNNINRNNLTGSAANQVSIQGPFTSVASGVSVFERNVIALFDNYAKYLPPGNFFPTSFDAIGFVGGAAAASNAAATIDDLALKPASPYKGKATDGTDIGADVAKVKAAIAGVVRP
jgi:hypothetical protein